MAMKTVMLLMFSQLNEVEDNAAKYVDKSITDLNTIINASIDSKISEAESLNIKANREENIFSFVMDDDMFREDDSDITKVGKVDRDYYSINKATYRFNISLDSSIGYYSTRLSIDLKSLDLGEYTLAYEMYYSSKIDSGEVVVGALSSTLSVSRVRTNTFSDHSRTIINFHKTGNLGIIDLDIDITLKYKSGVLYEPITPIYVVVYGLSGHQNDVEPKVWDRFYYIDKGVVNYEAAIDMNNHQIKGLGDGNEDGDAVNVKQLNEVETNLTNYVNSEIAKVSSEIAKVNPILNNNTDLIKAIYRNLIRNETKLLLIKELYFPDSNEGRTQDYYTYQSNVGNKGDVTFYLTFEHKRTTNDSLLITLNWVGGIPSIHIFVSRDKVVVSKNPLINEPSLRSINIPYKARGKQMYFWLFIIDKTIKIIFSGLSKSFTVSHDGIQNKDEDFSTLYVSDTPFTIRRGLITQNIYNLNSDAYGDVKEYEKSEGTII